MTLAIGFLAGSGSPGWRSPCAAIAVALLALRNELHGFVDRLESRRRQGAGPLRGDRRRGAAVPAQRPLRPTRRVEPAESVAGGGAGHRLLVPRLCRQPHFRRAPRDHRHGPDRRRLQLDRGHPIARPAARPRGARAAPSRPGSRSPRAVMYLRVILLVGDPFDAVPGRRSRCLSRPHSWSARRPAGGSTARRRHPTRPAPPGNPIAILPALGFLAFVAIAAVAARWAAGRFGEQGIGRAAADRRIDRRRYRHHHSGRASIRRRSAPRSRRWRLAGTVLVNMAVKLGITLAYARSKGDSARLRSAPA